MIKWRAEMEMKQKKTGMAADVLVLAGILVFSLLAIDS